MKKKKLLCLALVSALLLASASFAFAETGKSNKNGKPEKAATQQMSKEFKSQKINSTQLKDQLKSQKIILIEQKDQLESQKDQLEKDLESAIATGDEALATQIKTQIQDVKTQFSEIKIQMRANLAEKKRLIKEQYTSVELAAIGQAGENIKNSDESTRVLDVTSIVSDKKFKFDTPPVIKGNRTLIPVRAITEGLGAEVKWDAATKQITIVKDQTNIVLILGETTALVNGVEVKLDTNASTMNNRTYVPLRFIMETLKLQVSYEDGTIEINEPVDPTTPVDTTTEGAIDTTTEGAIDTTTEGAIDTPTEGAIDTTTQGATEVAPTL